MLTKPTIFWRFLNRAIPASPARLLNIFWQLGLLALTGTVQAPALAGESQDADSIRETAEAYALSGLLEMGYSDLVATAASLDPRLKLRECELPLEAFSSQSAGKIGRTTVGVRCTGQAPWTLYVPVNITASTRVVLVQGPLERGTVLGPQHLRLETMDLQQVPARYFTEPAKVLGLELSRAIGRDTIVTMNMLREHELINKGQEVVILASGDNIQVRMAGTALENGREGQNIKVRNSNSGRTVQARIRDAFTVEVAL